MYYSEFYTCMSGAHTKYIQKSQECISCNFGPPCTACEMATSGTSTSAAQLEGGGRGNTAGPLLSLRPFMFAEALSPVMSGLSDEDRCAFSNDSDSSDYPCVSGTIWLFHQDSSLSSMGLLVLACRSLRSKRFPTHRERSECR